MLVHILLSILFASLVKSQELTGDVFAHEVSFEIQSSSPNERSFHLRWNSNATHIVFEMRAPTSGWIGIGFSENSNMINADMHVGWIKDGEAYITDRYGVSEFNAFPPLDLEQNLQLIRGSECNGQTSIVFVRQLAGCQNGEDRPLTPDTARIIWAFGRTDPTGDDIAFVDYHLENKGTSSLYLFQDQEIPSVEDKDARTFDLRSSDELLPHETTYYQCEIMALPRLNFKHHVVKIELLHNLTYLRNLHHLVVFQCYDGVNPEDVGKPVQCYTDHLPPSFRLCRSKIIGTWAIGGGATIFPEQVGLPIGETNDTIYVNLEIHYDNPRRIDIRDNSGLRFTYTPNLKRYDAGVMNLGHTYSGLQLVVPPNLDKFEIEGGCGTACIGGAMKLAGVEEIHIFNIFLHSHLAGRKLKMRHIRNGVELPFIAKDDSYDFNYQRERILSPESTVRIGDELMTVCEYTSRNQNRPVLGGLGTDREMCLSFFLYYPRIPLDLCVSSPGGIDEIVYDTLGIESVRINKLPIPQAENNIESSIYNQVKNECILGELNPEKDNSARNINDRLVLSPAEKANRTVADVMSEYPWDSESGKTLERRLKATYRQQWCFGPQPNVTLFSYRAPIQVKQEYQEPLMSCVAPSSGFDNDIEADTSCKTI